MSRDGRPRSLLWLVIRNGVVLYAFLGLFAANRYWADGKNSFADGAFLFWAIIFFFVTYVTALSEFKRTEKAAKERERPLKRGEPDNAGG